MIKQFVLVSLLTTCTLPLTAEDQRPTPSTQQQRWVIRKKAVAIIVAAAMAIGGTVTGAYWYMHRRPTKTAVAQFQEALITLDIAALEKLFKKGLKSEDIVLEQEIITLLNTRFINADTTEKQDKIITIAKFLLTLPHDLDKMVHSSTLRQELKNFNQNNPAFYDRLGIVLI
jgi:hypothetical protein